MKKLFVLSAGIFMSISSLIAQNQISLTTLPFEIYGDHVFIKLKVNNSRNLNFIFDTGDGLTVLNEETARKLGMSSNININIPSAEGSIKGNLIKHQKIKINNLELKNVKIYETSINHLEISIGRNIDGIIGYDMLKDYVIYMNYDKKSMTIYDPSTYKYLGNGKTCPIKFTGKIPYIPATITFANNEVISGDFFINTGAKTTVDFNTPFVESNNLTSKVGKSFIYLVAGLGSIEYEHHEGKVNNFSFNDFSFDNMPVGLSHAKSGLQNHKKIEGIIGGGLLRKFNIVYDYNKRKIYWEKNQNYNTGFSINASGLELQLSKDKTKVLVHKVFDNSPASATGITVNSELNEINGKSALEIGLTELRKILRANGNTVNIKIDGKSYDITLKSMI